MVVDEYLTKPIDFVSLKDRITSIRRGTGIL